MFDSTAAAVMSYDDAGKYLGSEFAEGDLIPEFRAYRDTALAQAVPFTERWARHGE